MADTDQEFSDVFDVSPAPDTPMTEEETERFRNHLAVIVHTYCFSRKFLY